MNGDPGSNTGSGRWSMPSWKRFGDFVLTVFQLERSSEALKAENIALKARLSESEKVLADHGGQLKLLAGFVQDSLRAQVEMTAERAASKYIERLIDRRSSPPASAAEE